MTKTEIQGLYLSETAAGTLPAFRNGVLIVGPSFSRLGVVPADYEQFKAVRGYEETEED